MTDGVVRVSSRPRFAVLLDAFTVEDVVTLGLNCILGYVVAEPADGSFYHVGGEVRVRLTLQDKIGMVRLRPT